MKLEYQHRVAREWLVYSIEHASWHRAGFAGYSRELSGAGLFTAAEVARYGGNPNKDRIIHASDRYERAVGELAAVEARANALREIMRAPESDWRQQCRVCGVPITSAELCTGCASGNDPFIQSKYSTGARGPE